MKTTTIKIHCEGTPAQYWALKCFMDGECVQVHTSKSYSYILERQRNWKQKMILIPA